MTFDMMKHILLISLLGAGLMMSCFEDKGNYDYSDFTDPEISNVEDSYSKISFKDTLFINPEMTPADAEYDYLWTLNEAYVSVPSSGDGILKDTISMEKNLVYPMDLPTGTYEVCLSVKNRENGYTVFKNIDLHVQTEFSLGFYVLKETPEGNTEVDLHAPEALLDNLIEKSVGTAMAGKPKSMGLIFSYCYIDPETGGYIYPRALSVCVENDIRIFSLDDMTTIFTHEEMFYGDMPANDVPMYLYPNGYIIAYVSEAGVNYNYQAPRNVWGGIFSAGKFGVPLAIEKGYKPNINMVYSPNAAYGYFFDELNHRFFMVDFNGQQITLFDENDADDKPGAYSPNNVPADYQLIFFGRNNVTGEGADEQGYALFKDAQGLMHLYVLSTSGVFSNPILDVIDIPADKRMSDATIFSSNELGASRIYFNSGNEVWSYNVTNGEEKKLELQGFGGGEITYISNRYWTYADDAENNFNYLAVGTYQNGEYKIYMYETVGGEPTPGKAPARILEGEGKAIKVHFNSPMMDLDNLDASYYYPCSF
jgi:hypothetical protein